MSTDQQQAPEPPYQVTITFGSAGMQRAFCDWIASGEAVNTLWQWMGRHGYLA
jgi:hypothetical protein